MNTFFLVTYGICLLVGFVAVGFVSVQKSNVFQQAFLRVTIPALISLLGYWFKVLATTEKELVVSEKLVLIGGSATYFYMFLLILTFLGITLKNWIKYILMAISTVMACVFMSFDKLGLGYIISGVKSKNGGYSLELSTGFFSLLYAVMVVGYFVAMNLYVATYMKNQSKRKNRQTFFLLIPSIVSVLTFIIEANVHPAYSFTPIVLAFNLLFFLALIYIINIFDIDDSAKQAAYEKVDAALVVFSITKRFQNCNPLALKMFPELVGISAFERLEGPEFETILALLEGTEREVFYNGRIYENRTITLKKNGKVNGYLLWLSDVTSHREALEMFKNYQQELEKMVDDKTKNIIEIQSRILLGMADVIENRDGSTGGHVKRTSDVVDLLVAAMVKDNYPFMDTTFAGVVPKVAPLHDIGKLSITDLILCKQGKLTDEEFHIMQSHTTKGADMVGNVLNGVEEEDVLEMTKNVAKYHHERWDGKGYPTGCAGQDIPLEARVMAIADVYDALVSKRCYKEPMSFEEADNIMMSSFGTSFDPSLQKYYVAVKKDIEAYYTEIRKNTKKTTT